jgi:hypothetical protein
MPAHEVWKRPELARRFDHPQTRYPLCHFGQGPRDGKHQVGLRNGMDGRDKERNSERDVTLIFAFLSTPNDQVGRREIRGGFPHRLLRGILVPVTFRSSFARPAA